jgi:hypothetical protein
MRTCARDCVAAIVRQNEVMSDDPNKSGSSDRKRINMSQEHEVRYWTKELGVSAEELAALVKRVGPMAEDVRRAVAKKAG